MADRYSIPLRDGRSLEVDVLTFPIDSARQNALIGLWRTEWTGGDYDWLRSMNGDYSRHLRIQAVLGTIEGRPAGTASVCFPCREPEVSVVGSVLTHPECRRLGVAEALTSAVVDLSFRAGCRVSYLGATRDPRNVYLRCGFRWWNGGVMRLEREDSSGCEEYFFATGPGHLGSPGQLGGPARLCMLRGSSLGYAGAGLSACPAFREVRQAAALCLQLSGGPRRGGWRAAGCWASWWVSRPTGCWASAPSPPSPASRGATRRSSTSAVTMTTPTGRTP